MNRPAGVLSVVECVVDLYANRKLAISSLCVVGKDWISRSSVRSHCIFLWRNELDAVAESWIITQHCRRIAASKQKNGCFRTKNSLQRLMIRLYCEVTAVRVQVEQFQPKHYRQSFLVYLPVALFVLVHCPWRIGNWMSFAVGKLMHYDRNQPYGKASTANSTRRLEL